MILFWPGWLIFRIISLFYGLRFRGRENLPPRGEALLVVSNHNSRRDPVAICLALRRPVHYMAKKENFDPRNGLLECLMVRLFGAFPVNREHPGPEAIRITENLLARGKCVGIFPEGTRHPDTTLYPFEPGAAYIALRCGATILPVGIIEEDGRPYEVRIGKPFKLPPLKGRPREMIPKASAIIRGRVAELLPPHWKTDEDEM